MQKPLGGNALPVTHLSLSQYGYLLTGHFPLLSTAVIVKIERSQLVSAFTARLIGISYHTNLPPFYSAWE